MRRAVGIGLTTASAVAGVALLISGDLATTRVAEAGGGGTPTSGWHAVAVEITPNWLLLAPLAVSFLAGVLLIVLPQRR